MKPQNHAIATMTAATICYSILPTAIYLAGGLTVPFWFNASLKAGLIISSAGFITSTQRPVLTTI